MYLTRPKFWVSGNKVATALGFTPIRIPPRRPSLLPEFDFHRDFVASYDSRIVINGDQEIINQLRQYWVLNKPQQRRYLQSRGVKIPEDYDAHEDKWVIRPNRHTKGQHFQVVTGYRDVPSSHYIAPLFPKVSEWRMVFVKGQRAYTMRKDLPIEGIPVDQPWNHANGSSFMTFRERTAPVELATSVLADLQQLPIIKDAHIMLADIMVDANNNYAVCETGFLPGLSIAANVQTIANTWRDYHG